MHTERTWAPACEEMAKNVAFSLLDNDLWPDNDELRLTVPPEWEISHHKSSIFVRAMNITTHIMPGTIWVGRGDFHGEFYGQSDEILRSGWDHFALTEWEQAGAWHHEFLHQFLHRLKRNFQNHISSGAAQLFARLRSPLAPFERIFPDQWNFMALEPQQWERELKVWCDPGPGPVGERPMSARGPDGERIYSIYVAPAEERFDKLNASDKCRQSLRALLRKHPKRQPRPTREIIKEHAGSFGLSERDVESILKSVAAQEGNLAWFKAGRLPKSEQ
jgi:hypothetical protein